MFKFVLVVIGMLFNAETRISVIIGIVFIAIISLYAFIKKP
ncbi:hypothetical protein [Mammaliicoccus sciuri]|nr:hypothetical protein [Mammaliicoccus sciuri]